MEGPREVQRERAGRHELTELFRELQLLRLKHEHVVDICRKLTRSWPNRGSDGKLLKAQNKSTPTTVEEEQKSEDTRETATAGPSGNSDSPDLKLLDDILKKAKGIKLFDEEQTEKISLKRYATENCKKAVKIYQPQSQNQPASRAKGAVTRTKCAAPSSHRQLPSKAAKKDHRINSRVHSRARRVKLHHVTSGDPTTLPTVRIVKHAAPAESSKHLKRPDSHRVASRTTKHVESTVGQSTGGTSSLASSVTHRDEEEEIEKFCLSRDGSRLYMPSKYSTLRSTLLQIQEHMSSQVNDSSTEAMRDHFVKRLIPSQVASDATRALRLQLAKQEYQLMTEEFTDLSLRATGTQDGVSVKEKLELIVSRASAVEEELNHHVPEIRISSAGGDVDMFTKKGRRDTSGAGAGIISQDASLSGALPLAYSTLSELLQLVEMQHRHRMLEIEVKLLKFCTEVILPKYMCKPCHQRNMSTTAIQILSELAGQPKPIFISDS